MHRRSAFAAGLLSIALAGAVAPSRAEVALDPGFGTGGVVRTGFGANHADTPRDIVTLPDGRILVAGISDHASQEFYVAMARYSAAGELDMASFGTDGRVMFRDDYRDHANAIALQPDGRIIAVGSRWSSNFGSAEIPAIYRFEADGAIDLTFGTGGATVGRYDGVSSGEHAGVVVLADDRLVAAGRCNANANGGTSGFGTKRYLEDGAQQASVRVDRPVSFLAGDCAFAPNGDVLWANYEWVPANNRTEYVLARVDSAGTPDASFGASGVRATGIEAMQYRSMRLALLSDGRFLLAGTTPDGIGMDQMSVFRFNADGTLDDTFGTDGRVDLDFLPFQDRCEDLAVDPDGNIVLVGTSSFGSQQAALARLLPDGAPDESFAPGGKFNASLGTATASLTCVLPLPGGVILAAGVDAQSNGGDFMVARFLAPTVDVGERGGPPSRSPRVSPNPSAAVSRVSLSLDAGGFVRAVVVDVAGRHVRELFAGPLSVGDHALEWDGRDDVGRRVAPGAYLVRYEAGAAAGTAKVVRVR